MPNDTAIGPYYNNPRPEVLALIPESAKMILDIGCANGHLGASIRKRQQCAVTGIELVPEVAARASVLLDRVLVGDALTLLTGLPGASFDCIVMADSLEHMVETDGVLAQCRRLLIEGGHLVVSLPNIRHWSTVLMLLSGRWDYAGWGIMDRTHVRFFTISSALDLLRAHGFEHVSVSANWNNNENQLARQVPPEVLARFPGLLEESEYFQFIIQARCTAGVSRVEPV